MKSTDAKVIRNLELDRTNSEIYREQGWDDSFEIVMEFDEIEDLSEVLRFLEEKTLAYKEYVETSIQNKPETKRNSCRKKTKKDEEIELPVNWNIKQVELLKFCKTKISEMNNNIKNPVDSFNKVVMELQEKLSEYLESRKYLFISQSINRIQ